MESIEEQFSRIYDQYIERIYRFTYLKVNVREVAEDITSKVFTKGWESYQKGVKITNPGAFLYKIAHHSIIDYYRDSAKKKTTSTDAVSELVDKKTDIYEQALMKGDMILIRSAIGQLEEEYQNIIIWYYLEDMSAGEIANILERPVGTVRVMIHRALELLREKLVIEG